MLIAILADIHDNQANLLRCLSWCLAQKIKTIICLGDITTLETIKLFAAKFRGEIFIVRGNADLYEDADLVKITNIKDHGSIGFINSQGLKIGFTHEDSKIKKILNLKNDLDFIFYGHSHKPWLEKQGTTIISNPGNLAGVYYPASFAVLDTTNKNLSLKILSEL